MNGELLRARRKLATSENRQTKHFGNASLKFLNVKPQCFFNRQAFSFSVTRVAMTYTRGKTAGGPANKSSEVKQK